MIQIARRSVGAALLALALALSACQKREPDQLPLPEQPPAPAAAAVKKRLHPPLPENPELGAKSSAQWQEHLDEEEEHRQLCYDRDRLGQHREVTTQLASLRKRYDQARTEAELASARADAQRQAPALQKQLDVIDPWKNSSVALPEQQAMLKLLLESYPGARLEALRGNGQSSGRAAAELDRHAESLRQLLERAERCKDE
jgi:hypothetical protein